MTVITKDLHWHNCFIAGEHMEPFSNPVLKGFHPDPSICRAGQDYYLVTSSFAYFPGLPIYHSTDLVSWKLVGHALNRPEDLDLTYLGVSKGIFAPTIRFFHNRFYITCTLVDGGGNFVLTAERAAGPWSPPVWLTGINGIDPSLFFDPDGSCLILYNSEAPHRPEYNGHRTLRMRSFDPDSLCTFGQEIILVDGGSHPEALPRWIEAPHLYRVNSWYYLIAAEGGTGFDHSAVAFRSAAVEGPYIPCPDNPILWQHHVSDRPFATSAGHADLVENEDGSWWAVFLACRPYEGGHYNTGRETFLAPVRWRNGWPRINPDFDEVQPQYPLPLGRKAEAKTPEALRLDFKKR